jgi:hypothetical protein
MRRRWGPAAHDVLHAEFRIGTLIAGPDERWPNCGTQENQLTKRWYPTATAWRHKVVITDGNIYCSDHGEPNVPVVLELNLQNLPASTWRPLCGAKYGSSSSWDLDTYPLMFVLIEGQLGMCGGNWGFRTEPSWLTTRKLNVVTGTWDPDFQAVSGMTGISACMYAPDKVLKVGFLRDATATCGDPNHRDDPNTIAQRIDFSAGQGASWETIDPMPRRRGHFYLLPMPDGTVLAIGGPEAATHSFDMGTRSIELAFSSPSPFNLTVAPPPSENHAPPGYYMLFIASGPDGDTPSAARIVHLDRAID